MDSTASSSYGVLPGAPGWAASLPGAPGVRRVLVSATLAANPQRVAALRLRRPRLFITRQDVGELAGAVATPSRAAAAPAAAEGEEGKEAALDLTLPASLQQRMLVVAASSKPAALMWLLQGLMAKRRQTIVFANALATVHAVARTLALMNRMPVGEAVVEFSAAMPQGRRDRIIRLASAGFDACPLIIASDAAARGIDLPLLGAVVQYDAPPSIKAYAHRAGRAARAGRSGESICIVRPQQRRWLAGALRRVGVAEDMVRCPRSVLTPYQPRLDACLAALPSVLEAEESGTTAPHAAAPSLEEVLATLGKDADEAPDAPRNQPQHLMRQAE
jgi:superfamily II DNA/RNA helicase